MNLTDEQWDLLRSLVAKDESTSGAEFFFVRSHTASGITYQGTQESINCSESDLHQLRSERLITLIRVSSHVYRGKPTQLGITSAQRRLAVADEPVMETASANSAIWRQLREEFESLPPGEYSLIWSTCKPKTLDGETLASQWSWWHFPDTSVGARLGAIALKCAKVLGHDSEDTWFDELRKADFVKFKLTGRGREKQLA